MAIQLNAATRNARLDTIESTNGTSCALEIRTGAAPADCATAGTGTILVTINLPSDWMAAASSGSKAKSGTWQDASADNTGTAAHFRVYNSQATKDNTTCFIQGSVGQGSGDLSLDNTSIVAGQTVTITSFTLTDGNA
ncbi:MAG TPA: hypothetical protein VIX17_11435 [Pyrinomonadaceae bacterium]|jgi:hypothetical protein